MQAGPQRSTWIERWREPFDASHAVRACLIVGLMAVVFAVSWLLWRVAREALLGAVVRQFDAERLQRLVESGYSGTALALGRWLTGSNIWLGDPLRLGLLACVIALATVGLAGGPFPRKSAGRALLLAAVAAAAGLLIGLCCGTPLAKVGVIAADAPQAAGSIVLVFAGLCAAIAVVWVAVILGLERAGIPYPAASLLLVFMVHGWLVDFSKILQLARVGIYSGPQAVLAVALSVGASAVVGCVGGVVVAIWAGSGGFPVSAGRWAMLRDKVIPLVASVVLVAAAAAAVCGAVGAFVQLSAVPDAPQLAMQIGKVWAGFLRVLGGVMIRPVSAILSALVMLLLAVPSEPRDARGYVAEIRT